MTFSSSWDRLQSDWGRFLDPTDRDDPPTIWLGNLAKAFTEHTGEMNAALLLASLEDLLANGTQSDRDAVATGFFEALLGAWDRGFDLEAQWHLLGTRSRAYCRAWNEFTGVRTPDWMS